MVQGSLFDRQTAPYVPESDTSYEAAKRIEPALGRLQAKVLTYLLTNDGKGLTCDEIEEASGLKHQTASARIRELAQKGLIEDSGDRRPTRSGRNAVVWVVAGTR